MRGSRNTQLLDYLLIIVTAASAVSCFFLPAAGQETAGTFISLPWLSSILSMICLAAVAVSMGILNYSSFLFTSGTGRLYLPYLLTVLSVPGVMSFGFHHLSALLTVWSMFFTAGYINSEDLRTDYAFGAVLTAGVASMMVPYMTYVEIFVFLYCLYVRNQSLARYLLVSLAGAAVPWVYVAVWGFVFPDSLSLGDYAANFRHGMALNIPDFGGMRLSTLIFASFAVLLALRAMVFVLMRGRERNKAQKNSFGLSVALSVLSVLMTVFCGGFEDPLFILPAAVPVSFVTFDLFTNGRKAEVAMWIVLLVLLAAAWRILDFFPGSAVFSLFFQDMS